MRRGRRGAVKAVSPKATTPVKSRGRRGKAIAQKNTTPKATIIIVEEPEITPVKRGRSAAAKIVSPKPASPKVSLFEL